MYYVKKIEDQKLMKTNLERERERERERENSNYMYIILSDVSCNQVCTRARACVCVGGGVFYQLKGSSC